MITKHLSIVLLVLIFIVTPACNKASSDETHAGDTVFDFESDNQGWYSENENMTITHNTDPAYVIHGTGSVKGACANTGRFVLRNYLSAEIDLTGLTLTFNVNIPESLADLETKYACGIWLGVYTDQWSWMDGQEIDTAGWNQYSFTPEGIGEEAVYTVAFEINSADGITFVWSGDLYFDYIRW